jgi:amino acid transporter
MESRIPGLGKQEGATGRPAVFMRKSTGLVRTASAFDVFIFNAASISPIGVGLAVGIFWVMAVFPRTNILLAVLLAGIISIFGWVTFSLVTATMPRVGGDYIFVGRVIHPAVGFISNLCVAISSAFACGYWVAWISQLALGPMFTIFGSVTGSTRWMDAGAWVLKPSSVLLLGAVFTIILCAVMAMGLKTTLRVQNWSFLIGVIGFVITLIVMLTASRDSFVSNFNAYAQQFTQNPDSYNFITTSAQQGGLAFPSEAGYSGTSTLGSIYVALGIIAYTWWSVYLAGEMKGANSAKRWMGLTMGAGLLQTALLIGVGAWFLHIVGYNFMSAVSANGIGEGAPTQAYYVLFTSLLANNKALQGLIAFTFIGWMFPGVFINMAMVVRGIFAWSFDGLFPKFGASVNERTHAPLWAIALTGIATIGFTAWTAYSATFFKIWSMAILFAFVPMFFVGLVGIWMPLKRKDLFKNSPADIRIFGVPVLPIAGAGSMATVAFVFYELMRFPSQLGGFVPWQVIVVTLGTFAFGGLYYYAMRAYRKSKGVNLDLIYKEIPPE